MKINRTTNIFRERKLNMYWLCGIISVVSMAAFIFIIERKPTGIYQYIYFLPLFYACFSIIFIKAYSGISLISGIIIAFMFLRYTVSPFMVALDDFPKGLYYINIDKDAIVYANFEMILEMLMLFLGLYIISKKKVPRLSNEQYFEKLFSRNNFAKLNVIMKLLIIFTVAIFAVWPALFTNYSFIISDTLDSLTLNAQSVQSSLPSGMRWVGYTCGEVVRNVVIEFVILNFYKRYNKTQKMRYWYLSLLLILINGLITTSRIMLGLFTSIVYVEQIYFLYPKKRKALFTIGVGIGGVLVVAIAVVYLSNTMQYQSISQLLQGYTNGYYNVYQSYCAYKNADQGIIDKIVMFFMGDGLGNVNVISIFINGTNSSDLYNNYIYGRAFNGGAVVPFVSQLSYYFSVVLAPFASLYCVLKAKKYEIRWKSMRGNALCNGLISVVLAAVPFMYNLPTLIHILTILVLPIWIAYQINALVK